MRHAPWVLFGLILTLAIPSTTAGEADLLIRVERQTRDDLSTLLGHGFAVVFEVESDLLIEGDAATATRLEQLGRKTDVLDVEVGTSDYVAVGLRPDSDVDAVLGHGSILLEQDNWVLVKIPRDADLGALIAARVFVTRLSHDPLAMPRPGPAPRRLELDVSDPPDPRVQRLVDAVDVAEIDRVFLDLTVNAPTGTRYSTHQGCRDAAQYCKDVYDGLGIPAVLEDWSSFNTHAPNAVATLEGLIAPDEVYIVIGHLDDLPSSGAAPGADDNASGSVVVLESARVMACETFRSTVKFLNVTGEELGLLGSEAYADDAELRGEDIRGVINMDMVAWEGNASPNPEDLDLNFNGPSEWLGQLFAECATRYGTGLVVDAFYCPSLTASDHYPFWQKGWPAVCGITDNEGYCGHGGNYPYYHTSDDTIANCGDPGLFHGTVRTTVATLGELAKPFKAAFDRPAAACGDDLRVLVGDRHLDTDPGWQESVAVEVWSDSEAAPETVTALEEGTSSALFTATVPTASGAPVAGDGIVAVAPGDRVFVRYVDALDCDGSTAVESIGEAVIDCAIPAISAVDEVAITDVSAEIEWATNESASSTVRWGETVPPQHVESTPGLDTAHGVTLAGLQACTVYYYQVESADAAGNVAVDDNAGQYHRFETYGDFGSGLQPCHAGLVTLDADPLGCDAAATFRVVDLDLNLDPQAVDTATVTVSSFAEAVPETVVVTETGPNTSTFTGTINLVAGTPASDGALQVDDHDVVTVQYRDADDGTGAGVRSFDTAPRDCGGPLISNLRLEDVTDRRLVVRLETDEAADVTVEWGATPALGETAVGSAAATDHVVVLNRLSRCDSIHVRVTATDAFGNGTVSGSPPHVAHTWDIPGLYWQETFENGLAGWTLQNEWQIGAPGGLGGSSGFPDPVAAYTHDGVLGTDLTGLGSNHGDYENALILSADGPELDARTWTNTKLLIARQLNVMADDAADIRSIERNKDHTLWDSGGQAVTESGWSVQAINASAGFDGKRDVKLRFTIAADGRVPSGDDGVGSGWNIDDVILKDGTLPDFAGCGGCATAPEFLGAESASDVDACGAGGVVVSWDPAIAWGTGSGGTYAVYRDVAPGFEPGASNRIASGVSGATYVDTAAPQDATSYYLVLAENDETCGGGPGNGGLLDDNRRYATVTESTSQLPADAVTGMHADLVNGAHVRLSWPPSSGAATYRVYRSDAPGGGFAVLGDTAATSYDDTGEGGNLNARYYVVGALDPCGRETP